VFVAIATLIQDRFQRRLLERSPAGPSVRGGRRRPRRRLRRRPARRAVTAA
jgi:hypothetical protein